MSTHPEVKTLVLLLITAAMTPGEDRAPWATSRIHGSPEPPMPYVPERALHAHTFGESTELDFVPGSNWALVIEQSGKLYGIDRANSDEIAELADFAGWNGGPVECYSIAFHPRWDQNRFAFIALHDRAKRPKRLKIVRFTLHPGSPPALDPGSGKILLEWELSGHKGCDLQFGPDDGCLYISVGDGEVPAPPDKQRTGQDISDLNASILRIDVDREDGGRQYGIPDGNPFVATAGARPEVWSYGFRNPWKMSFDPRDGALWIGDVGWEMWEMVFRIDHGGFNGGWSIVEGPQSVNTSWPVGPTAIEKPVISHSHSEAVSITGGMIYRGDRLPELRNAYIYGDWGTGKIWALWWEDGAITRHVEIANSPHRIIGFAEDESHELFYMDHADGSVYRLAPNSAAATDDDFPRRLSETGLFASTRDHALAPGVHEFEIAAPMWNDHATARRAVAFPDLATARIQGNYFESPAGAVFLRTLSMEMTAGVAESARRIETQMLHFDGTEWRGYSYRWTEDQTDADLVAKDGAATVLDIADATAPGGRRSQRWQFHSRADCARCHLVDFHKRHGNLNAFTPTQLASRTGADGQRRELDRLIDLGLIAESARDARPARLVKPTDASAPLTMRARSYLHANCSHCHKPGSTGAVTMYWPVNFNDKATGAFDVAPARGAFGTADARIVAPGRAGRSTLLYRMLTTGTGRMPAIGSHEIDAAGVTLLRRWIDSLPSTTNPRPGGTLDDTAFAIDRALDAITMDSSERAKLTTVAMASTNPSTRDLFQHFLPADQRRQVLGSGFDPESVLERRGDRERGRALFFSPSGPRCFTCHRIEGRGIDLGPELSNLGKRYSREQVLSQIIAPNAALDARWKLHVIATSAGEIHTGFIMKSDDGGALMMTTSGIEIVIRKDAIQSDVELPASLMPERTLDALTAREAADLLEFLSM